MLWTLNDHGGPRRGIIWVAAAALLAMIPLAGCGESSDEETLTVGKGRTTEERSSASEVRTEPIPGVEPIAVIPEVPGEDEVPIEDTSVSTVPVITEPVSFEDAEFAFHEKRYDEAVDLFTAYTERRPENAWGHYMLGLSAWKAGDPVWAEQAFEQALERDPQHVKSLLNLSRVLLETDRPEEALVRVEAALAIEPESNDGFRLVGRAHDELGELEKAIESYRHAIMIDPYDAWSMNNLGLILIRQERFEEALLPLARAVEIGSDIAVFQNNLGIALERAGHLVASADAYRRALDIDRSYEKASVSLSRVEELEGDPDQGPVDLGVLAERFALEVQGWRETVTADASPETTETEEGGETQSVDAEGVGDSEGSTGEESKETESEKQE